MNATMNHSIELSFTSIDLTDTYPDNTSQYSDSTVGNRHDREDRFTPASYYSGSDRGGGSSRLDSSYFGFRNGVTANSNGEREGLPNLERLLDFLDDEESDGWARNGASNTINSRQFTSSFKHDNNHQVIPSSSTPPLSTIISQTSPISPPQPLRYDPARPFASSNPTSVLHTAELQNNAVRNRTLDMDRSTRAEELRNFIPESPSPLPGSLSGTSSRNVTNALKVNGNSKGKERAYEAPGLTGSRQEIPVSAEVLDEFSLIISKGSPNRKDTSRPLSRLENFQSLDFVPLHQAPPPSNSNGIQRPVEEGNISRDIGSDHREIDEDREDLLEELRKAKDYIAHLQSEIQDIGVAVKDLRIERSTSSKNYNSSLQTSPQDTLELAKHVLSLLPITSPGTPTPLPSAHSIVLALEFTRSIDTLLQSINISTPQARAPIGESIARFGEGGKSRRDEDIFIEENLEGLFRRVKGWERGVR